VFFEVVGGHGVPCAGGEAENLSDCVYASTPESRNGG